MIIYGPSETSNTHLSKGVIKIRFVFIFGFFSEDITNDASHILKLWCKITVHTHKIICSTWEWAFWTLIYQLIINMFWTSALIFLIWLLFRGKGRNPYKNLIVFLLVNLKTPKGHLEINWPLKLQPMPLNLDRIGEKWMPHTVVN